MMKKMNKKLLGSLILGLMLSVPVSQVCAADLTGGSIYGTGDGYSSNPNIVTKDGNTLTYNFDGEESTLKFTTRYLTGQTGAIFIDDKDNSDDFNTIKINDPLNIEFDLQNNSGAVSGISITGGNGKTIDRSKGGDITINSSDDRSYTHTKITGVDIYENNNKILLGNGNITIEVSNVANWMYIDGLLIGSGQGNTIEMGDGEIKITSNLKSNVTDWSSQVLGFKITGSDNLIKTGNVSMDIEVTGDSDNATPIQVWGAYAMNGGNVSTQNGDIKVAAIDQTGGTVESYGLFASTGGNVTKEGGDINVIAEGKGTVQSIGIVATSGTVNLGPTNINAQATGNEDNVAVSGMYSLGTGEITYAGGQINTVAYNSDGTTNEQANVWAIRAKDSATVKVNENSKNKVVINGDVNNTGTGAIYLYLNTADSVLNGAVDDEKGTFNLEDGAQWNVLGTSTVNKFHMKDGIINMARNYNVNIASYSGDGTISFLAEDEAANGVASFENVGNVTIENVTIENAEEGASVTLGIANNKIDTLDIGKTEESLNALAKKIFYDANNGNLTGEAVIREGLITPEARGDLLFDANDQGYVTNITGGDRTTDTMYAMKNLAATAIVAWRQEDSTFSQRLGELRESTGGQGIWARMSRGEFEYDGEYKNQYNFFQLGYDWASDNWHYGVAVSHNDGETAYTYGSGENRSTSLSLYGTWLGDAGHYADIVLKQGRLSNDFDVYTSAEHTSGDYDAWGTSLSGEYGRKFVLEDDWYVTPQAQLTLMRIGGEDYDTNNGIRVRQDTLYSAVGRLGFELGRKLDEKGSVYAKASVLHDFAGNAETYLTYNDIMNSYSQDLSDTWFEAGLGFNYRTGDNSYIYADVVRTFGGDVETPWQWNIGMRWSC